VGGGPAVRRLWVHLRTLWPGWGILTPVPFFLHAVWAATFHEFRWENAAVLGTATTLFAVGPRTKKLLLGVYPLGLVGLFYTTMKVARDVGVSPETVHVCDLRNRELALFGMSVHGQRVTLHDWFQAHATRVLDVLCAVPYATFMFVVIGCAVWLYFKDLPRMARFAWGFFALNVAGFVTYHVYPAAPPWYFHTYGCRVDMLAPASEGPNLARVDSWLGIHYFAGMYGRASDVFGAMPSLHVAYALIVVLEGWSTFGVPFRIGSILFYVAMCFSAVYLDHHWVLDVIVGSIYCAIVVVAVEGVARLRSAGRSSVRAALGESDVARGAP
jgi:inositol phosphorylceramide synthase catalytic subunit